jgi:hypothetical protein
MRKMKKLRRYKADGYATVLILETQVGRQAGGDGAVPSRAKTQCECALTYMNAVFPKNLTDALSVHANTVGTTSETGRRTQR